MGPRYVGWRDYCNRAPPLFPPHGAGNPMTSPVLGVIPARLASTRLPRKPLHPIAGRPLLEWVWRRVRELGVFDAVVVATDSPEVESAARAFGARAVLPRADHP